MDPGRSPHSPLPSAPHTQKESCFSSHGSCAHSTASQPVTLCLIKYLAYFHLKSHVSQSLFLLATTMWACTRFLYLLKQEVECSYCLGEAAGALSVPVMA